MKKTIIFLKKPKDDIPSISANERSRNCNCSDFFFAKVKTIGGEESNSIVCYDFEWSKWRSIKSGFSEVIEYYVFDEKFDNWLHTDIQDVDTFFDIFNSMDECDR